MKKLLLGTAAVALAASFVASPASAQIKLGVGGHAKIYGTWLDQDTASDESTTVANESEDHRAVDILRETEVHMTGETTLDNGLTVGVHAEMDLDGQDAGNVTTTTVTTEEGYGYFSGAWGRVNLGAEDGAAYLLQVAAPSADSNFDGIRQWVDPVNTSILERAPVGADIDNLGFDELFDTGVALNDVIVDADGNDVTSVGDVLVGANGVGVTLDDRIDYDQAVSGNADKLTYMTPVFNGFQAGVSYTPELGGLMDFEVNDDDTVGDWGDVWEIAARYEGMLGQVGVALGAGYSHAELEADNGAPVMYQEVDGVLGYTAGADAVVATLDDNEAWNIGADLNWQAFGIGAVYMEDDNGVSGDKLETETWVVGVDYTTGPFKLGASYLNQEIASAEVETDRWTGGVVYTYGPGLTFRGSVSYIDFDEDVGFEGGSADATSLLIGTQMDF